MVTPPLFKKPVFVRALRDVGDIDVAEYVFSSSFLPSSALRMRKLRMGWG